MITSDYRKRASVLVTALLLSASPLHAQNAVSTSSGKKSGAAAPSGDSSGASNGPTAGSVTFGSVRKQHPP